MRERETILKPLAAVGIGTAGVLLVTIVLVPFGEDLTRVAPALLLLVPVVISGLLGGRLVAVAVAAEAAIAFASAFIPPIGSPAVEFGDRRDGARSVRGGGRRRRRAHGHRGGHRAAPVAAEQARHDALATSIVSGPPCSARSPTTCGPRWRRFAPPRPTRRRRALTTRAPERSCSAW